MELPMNKQLLNIHSIIINKIPNISVEEGVPIVGGYYLNDFDLYYLIDNQTEIQSNTTEFQQLTGLSWAEYKTQMEIYFPPN